MRWQTADTEQSRDSFGAGHLRSLTTCVAHVLPVSDDGGSTAEIVRVLGGPAVGDIRSRCLRLADDSNAEVCTQSPQWLLALCADQCDQCSPDQRRQTTSLRLVTSIARTPSKC